MSESFDIWVRVKGKERWANACEVFAYLSKEHENSQDELHDNDKTTQQFMKWWNLYNKKRDKKKTKKYWDKSIKQKDIELIMEHSEKYVQSTEKNFRKDPHSYLLNESWENEIIIDDKAIEEDNLKTREKLQQDRDKKYYQRKFEETKAMRSPEQNEMARKENEE